MLYVGVYKLLINLKWPIVQDTGSTQITHDQQGSLTRPLYSINTRDHFTGKNQCTSPFCTLKLGERVIQLAIRGRKSSVLPQRKVPSK